LGQNFSKAQEIKFLNQEGKETYAWTTSWGVSTRLVGALVMTHSDDDGLVLPPRLAPAHVVVMPIYRSDDEKATVLDYCRRLERELTDVPYSDGRVRVVLDARDMRGGEKKWYHVKRGVPLRLEIGPRDIQSDSVALSRRDKPEEKAVATPRGQLIGSVTGLLDGIQNNLFQRALALRESATRKIDDRREFEAFFTPKDAERPEIHGGFALCHVAEAPEADAVLKDLKVTVRCLPLEGEAEPGKCLITGQSVTRRAVLAKAY
jgi:prolyl-tRNA synthetase